MSSPQQRLSSIANQVQAPGSAPARQRLLAKHPDDIVSVPLHYTYWEATLIESRAGGHPRRADSSHKVQKGWIEGHFIGRPPCFPADGMPLDESSDDTHP